MLEPPKADSPMERAVSDETGSILWDDNAFRARVRAAAAAQGRPLGSVLIGAGLSEFYLRKKVEGRSTNIVMKLARELGMTPTELAGWPMTTQPDTVAADMPVRLGNLLSQAPAQHVQMFAMQVAAILAAKTGRDEDVMALARLIIERTVGQAQCQGASKSGQPAMNGTESDGIEDGAAGTQQRREKRRKVG